MTEVPKLFLNICQYYTHNVQVGVNKKGDEVHLLTIQLCRSLEVCMTSLISKPKKKRKKLNRWITSIPQIKVT